MFDHPLNLQGVYSSNLYVNFHSKMQKQNLRAHWQKNSTTSLKNSTGVSASSAHLSNTTHGTPTDLLQKALIFWESHLGNSRKWSFFCFFRDRQTSTQTLHHNPARALRALGLLLADGAPTVGRGKPFWQVSRIFFMETAVTPERIVEKSFPRSEINRHDEG